MDPKLAVSECVRIVETPITAGPQIENTLMHTCFQDLIRSAPPERVLYLVPSLRFRLLDEGIEPPSIPLYPE